MTNGRFEIWFNDLKNSGKSDEVIGEILAGVAKYSDSAIYEAITITLTDEDIEKIKHIKSGAKAKEKIERLFIIRSGMTIDELVGKVQMYLIEGTYQKGDRKLKGKDIY